MDLLTRSFLFTANEGFLVFFLVVGFMVVKRSVFGRALLLLAFTLIFNRYLKSLWQVPLPSTLDKAGWAFPSGHMQSAVVLWGWLAWEFKKTWFYGLVSILLMGVGYSLVYRGYHYPMDVLGGVFFGILSIVFYHFLCKTRWFSNSLPFLGFIFSVGGWILIFAIPGGFAMQHILFAEGVLMGFSLGWWYSQKKVGVDEPSLPFRITGLFIALIGVAIALYFGVRPFPEAMPYVWARFSFGLILCFWISGVSCVLPKVLLPRVFASN